MPPLEPDPEDEDAVKAKEEAEQKALIAALNAHARSIQQSNKTRHGQ